MARMTWTLVCLLLVTSSAPGRQQDSVDQAVKDLTEQISREMNANRKSTIAVVEFADLKGNVTDLGRFLAEELITRLYQTRKFRVIERQMLNKVIREQKLTLTSIVDPSFAKQLGSILGVEAIASGTIADLGSSLKINARLVSTMSGEIFAVASTRIAKDESAQKMMAPESRNAGSESSSHRQTRTVIENEVGKTKRNDFYEITVENAWTSNKPPRTNICNFDLLAGERVLFVRFAIKWIAPRPTTWEEQNQALKLQRLGDSNFLIVDDRNRRIETKCEYIKYIGIEEVPRTVVIAYAVSTDARKLIFRFERIGGGDPIMFDLTKLD